jgi:SpoVK/Ycf46/Vps4 family AAA+-type ATPase
LLKYFLGGKKMSKDKDILQDPVETFNQLIGLKGIKEVLEYLFESKLTNENQPPGNYIFLGSRGTGKTMVARLMGPILKAKGFLKSGHVVEVRKTDLVVEVMGESAPKTRAKCQEALEGVLFVNDAFDLIDIENPAGWFYDDYCREACEELLDFMRNNKNICIIYEGGLVYMDLFIRANQAMLSCLDEIVNFANYSLKDLYSIFELFANQDGYSLSEDCVQPVRRIIKSLYMDFDREFLNICDMRTLLERSKTMIAERMIRLKKKDPKADIESLKYTLTAADIEPYRESGAFGECAWSFHPPVEWPVEWPE